MSPLPNRDGRFRAKVLEMGVGETGANNLVTAVARYQLLEELVQSADGASWLDVSSEQMEITGYHYIEKTVKDAANQVVRNPDGKAKTELNTRTIEDLKNCFGWDGRDIFWLQDHASELPMLQVTLGWETYQGKDRIKLQWINPYESEGGGGGAALPKADPNARKAIAARLGSQLRALAGGSPAAMPPKPAAVSAQPAAPAAPAPTAPPAGPPNRAATATMQDAWAAFCAGGQAQGASQEDIQQGWFDAIEELRAGATAETLTPEEWGKLKANGFRKPLSF